MLPMLVLAVVGLQVSVVHVIVAIHDENKKGGKINENYRIQRYLPIHAYVYVSGKLMENS